MKSHHPRHSLNLAQTIVLTESLPVGGNISSVAYRKTEEVRRTSKLVYNFDGETRPELRPLYNTCTDTNGPSTKVYLDERGFLNERLPGDSLYWDATDPRPWATYLNISDERYARYLENLEGERN